MSPQKQINTVQNERMQQIKLHILQGLKGNRITLYLIAKIVNRMKIRHYYRNSTIYARQYTKEYLKEFTKVNAYTYER